MLQINLLPVELKRIHNLRLFRTISLIMLIAAFAAMAAIYLLLRCEVEGCLQEQNNLTAELKLLKPVQAEQKEQAVENKQAYKLIERLIEMSKSRYSMHALLVHMGTLITDNVKLTELHADKNGSVELIGKAVDRKALLSFVKNCSANQQIFRTVDLVKTENISTKDEYQFKFVLQAEMKNGDDKQDGGQQTNNS